MLTPILDIESEYLNKYLTIEITDSTLKHLSCLIEITQNSLTPNREHDGFSLLAEKISPYTEQLLFLQEMQRNELQKKYMIEKFLNAKEGIIPKDEDTRLKVRPINIGLSCSCYSRTPEHEIMAVRTEKDKIDIFCKSCRRALPQKYFIKCLEQITKNARDEYEDLLKHLNSALEQEKKTKDDAEGEKSDGNTGSRGEVEDSGGDAQNDV